MRLSKTELKVILKLASGEKTVSEIALSLNKNVSQIYRILKKLEDKGFARLERGEILPSENTHANILLQELSRNPNIITNLSGCGIQLFTAILEPKKVSEIIKETGIKRSTVFYKLQEATNSSLVNSNEGKYFFNEEIWPKIKEFLAELERYEENIDKRIPSGASIYFKNDEKIVFSTKSECDATLTGFSAYKDFGIKIYTTDNNYCLPKRNLTKQEVFLHSIYRAEKEGDARDYTLIALFYVKYKNALAKIKNDIISNIDKVLHGEKIKHYPSLAEMREKADVYNIKI